MTIIWCGGEDIDLTSPTCQLTGYSSNSEGGLSRIGIGSDYEVGQYFKSAIFEKQINNIWVHYRTSSNIGYPQWFRVADSNERGIQIYNDTSYVQLSLVGSSETVIATSQAGYDVMNVDINIINYGSNGTINVYRNGELIITYTGNILISGCSGFCQLVFGGDYGSSKTQFIVADEDTRLMRLMTLTLSSDGDINQWNNNYTAIDEIWNDITDKIYTNTQDKDYQCQLNGLIAGTYSIKAVKITTCCVDSTGELGIQLGVKTNNQINVSETTLCSGYWQNKWRIMQNNPITGLEWTPAEIDNLQVNLRSKSI